MQPHIDSGLADALRVARDVEAAHQMRFQVIGALVTRDAGRALTPHSAAIARMLECVATSNVLTRCCVGVFRQQKLARDDCTEGALCVTFLQWMTP